MKGKYHKWNFEEINNILKQERYILLSREYEHYHSQLRATCPNGHDYSFTWSNFQRGIRCRCQKNNQTPWNIEMICKKLKEENYTLLSEKYINNRDPIQAECPNGHIFIFAWSMYLRGMRCSCATKRIDWTIEKIRQHLLEEGYVLISTEYRYHQKLHALCPKGHHYEFSWYNFLCGYRCRCKNSNPLWTIDSIKIYLGQNAKGYNLLSNEYVNATSFLSIKCDKGHEYPVRWNNFQQGHRCPKCIVQSQAEKEIISIFNKYNPVERNRQIIKPYELDLYFSTEKVAIEYCGLYWHSTAAPGDRRTSNYHRNKLDLCTKQNIRLLTIFEDEWLNHKDICISRINSALGVVQNKIFARKCLVKQIPNKEAREFLARTHLQGVGSCKIAYGLFYNNQLVQVMTFGAPSRAHTSKGKRVLEMKRLAGELNIIITGGASKLFKLGLQYAKDNNYEIVKSYCDLRWGTGNLYAKLGFIKTHETKYTPHYTDLKCRFRNQTLATNRQKENKTENEKAIQKQLYKIYDCGHQTWEYGVKRYI